MALTVARSARVSTISASRPSKPVSFKSVRAIRFAVVPRSVSQSDKSALESAIKEAEETCQGGTTGECASAWDNVEEISAAISHKKAAEIADPASNDPLEKYCESNPDADECRVYDD